MPTDSDGYDCFRELIRHLRDEHFDDVAGKIDFMLHHVAWTTGSELMGEIASSIRDFERTQPAISPSLQASLDACMQTVLRVWPDFPR